MLTTRLLRGGPPLAVTLLAPAPQTPSRHPLLWHIGVPSRYTAGASPHGMPIPLSSGHL
jgi:hypothetical protein